MTLDLFERTEREIAIDTLHAATAIYTRHAVVEQLLDMLPWPDGTKRLCEPSAGAGAFLGPALERLLANQPSIDDEGIVEAIEGWEIHELAAAEARVVIAEILRAHGRSATRAVEVARRVVRHGDFLLDRDQRRRFDVIVSNPPYIRMVGLPQPLRGDYERALPAFARADLLHSFLAQFVDALNADGELAAVTSDRWLSATKTAKLRRVLGERLSIGHSKRLDSESAFYRPKQRTKGTPPRVHPLALLLRPHRAGDVRLTEDPIYVGADSAMAPYTGRTLSDVATVKLAPYLGTPGVFTMKRQAAGHLPEEDLVPAVDVDDVKGGVYSGASYVAIRTSASTKPCPAVMAHLEREMARMAERGKRRKVPWLPPESISSIDISKPYLLVPRIAKSLRPVRIPAGVLPINHNIHVVAEKDMSLDDLERILRSEAAQKWVRARAPGLENGYFSLSTGLLRNLPVDL